MHSNDLEKYQQMVEETIDLEELDKLVPCVFDLAQAE